MDVVTNLPPDGSMNQPLLDICIYKMVARALDECKSQINEPVSLDQLSRARDNVLAHVIEQNMFMDEMKQQYKDSRNLIEQIQEASHEGKHNKREILINALKFTANIVATMAIPFAASAVSGLLKPLAESIYPSNMDDYQNLRDELVKKLEVGVHGLIDIAYDEIAERTLEGLIIETLEKEQKDLEEEGLSDEEVLSGILDRAKELINQTINFEFISDNIMEHYGEQLKDNIESLVINRISARSQDDDKIPLAQNYVETAKEMLNEKINEKINDDNSDILQNAITLVSNLTDPLIADESLELVASQLCELANNQPDDATAEILSDAAEQITEASEIMHSIADKIAQKLPKTIKKHMPHRFANAIQTAEDYANNFAMSDENKSEMKNLLKIHSLTLMHCCRGVTQIKMLNICFLNLTY